MRQAQLRSSLEGILGDLAGIYDPDGPIRESIIDWLVAVAREAAFGERAVELDRCGAVAAFSLLEAVVREPLVLEARISRRLSRLRRPHHDYLVAYHHGDAVAAEGAAPLLSLAVMHAARSLART